MNVNGKVVFVSGGASGLGEAVVRRLVSLNAKAVILDMSEANGSKLAAELGGNALFVKANVTDENEVKAAVEAAIAKFGAIDILVNTAGIDGPEKVVGKAGPASLAKFSKVIQVNLIGLFNVIRLVAEKMIQNTPNEEGERGVIINTASIAAFDGQIGQASYAASKGGIVGMTLPIAREFAKHGIRVVTIAPGIFKTPLLMTLPEKVLEDLGNSVPFPKRLGKPEEFAMLVESIVENPMINGETIRLDGVLRMS